jgi:hypothetical protein
MPCTMAGWLHHQDVQRALQIQVGRRHHRRAVTIIKPWCPGSNPDSRLMTRYHKLGHAHDWYILAPPGHVHCRFIFAPRKIRSRDREHDRHLVDKASAGKGRARRSRRVSVFGWQSEENYCNSDNDPVLFRVTVMMDCDGSCSYSSKA